MESQECCIIHTLVEAEDGHNTILLHSYHMSCSRPEPNLRGKGSQLYGDMLNIDEA